MFAPLRGLRLLGVVLLGAGLAMGAWFAWQLWGTNWTSARLQERIVHETEGAWAHGRPGSAQGIVRIPAFGPTYAIPVNEFHGYDDLHAGFGHLPETASVGEVGNYVIVAHRTTRNEPLRNLPALEVGDTVIIETASRVYTYRLTTAGSALRVDMHDTWVTGPVPRNPRGGVEPPQRPARLITLLTCAELFHTDDRLAVFGVLDHVRRKAEPGTARGSAGAAGVHRR